MKPKYPGVQHITFAEVEEFTRRLLRCFTPYQHGAPTILVDPDMLRNAIAEVYHRMVREQVEEPSDGR